MKKAVDRALSYATVGMRTNRMYLTTLYIAEYSDLSLANNFDLSFQINGLIVLRDLQRNAALTQ